MNGGFHYGFSKGNTSYTNCSFKNSLSQNGGVVYMSTTATTHFINCTVENVTSMDGGAIAHFSRAVYCCDSGSTATVRPPTAAPSAAPPCPLRAAGAAAFLGPVSPFFPAVFWPVGTAVRQR